MRRKEKLKITRLCIFVLNMQTLDMTSNLLLSKSIGRMYPWPNVINMKITVNTKFNKHMSTLTKQIRYLLANTGPLESFILRTPAFEEEVDFTPTEKKTIFRAISRHPLLVLELSEYPFKDLIYLAESFINNCFPQLISLSLMSILPSKGMEDTLGIITKGFSEAKSIETLKASIIHTNIEEAVQLIKVLREVPNVQVVDFSFPLFTKGICAVYKIFFEKPKIKKIVTKAYEYNDNCMDPFIDMFYLVPNLKCVKFNCLKNDADKVIHMETLFRVINCSCLQQLVFKNICVKDIENKARLVFSKTSLLKKIKLENTCSMTKVPKFLSSINETPNLETLSITFTLCSKLAVEAFGNCITMASNLLHVDLENCRIPDLHFASLRPARLLKKIKTLKLRGNYLGYNTYLQIIEILKSPVTVIEYIDVTDMDIPTDKIYEIFKVMQSHPTLKVFLWDCIYGSIMYDNFHSLIKSSGLLERISIWDINFSPLAIFKALKKSSKLEYLSFGVSSFDHMAVRKLWKLCEKNRSLKLLRLNLARTNFNVGISFDYFFNELIKRLKPKDISMKLKRYSKEDREYKITIRIIKKLRFTINLDISILEKYVKQWWDFKTLHSMVIKDDFISTSDNWNKWIKEQESSEELKESIIFYLY